MAPLGLCSGTHKAAIKVSAGVRFHIKACLGGKKSASKFTQVVGRIHFLASTGLVMAYFYNNRAKVTGLREDLVLVLRTFTRLSWGHPG